jgi:hypothetical protein
LKHARSVAPRARSATARTARSPSAGATTRIRVHRAVGGRTDDEREHAAEQS